MNHNVLETLETPAAVVDLDRVEANLKRAADFCREHGLAWRPHAKTHKTPELAAMQVAAGAVGVTVATLREAEVMATAVEDLLLAYPPIGAVKQRRLGELLGSGARLCVGLDSVPALDVVAAAAQTAGSGVGVLVELDVGMGRVGVGDAAEAVALARRAAETPGVDFRGVMFYPGHIRSVVGDSDPRIGEVSRVLGRFLDALTAAGLPAAVVSGGSTPTFWHSHLLEGLTEVRPGTNIFNDRTTVVAGACTWDECAYTVLATVVSTSVAGQAVIDAGSKAVSREELRGDGGYGSLLGRPDVVLRALSEEHGILDLTATDWRPEVGDRVRVIPNHVCVSVNLQETLWAVRGSQIEHEWTVRGRGRSRFHPHGGAAAASRPRTPDRPAEPGLPGT